MSIIKWFYEVCRETSIYFLKSMIVSFKLNVESVVRCVWEHLEYFFDIDKEQICLKSFILGRKVYLKA